MKKEISSYGAPVQYDRKKFLAELMDHIGLEDEPDWVLRKLLI